MFEGLLSDQNVSDALLLLAKLGIGAILGGIIGWEREMHGRPAGVRTHMLVVVGVILFSECSRNFGTTGDPARIAAQIVTGIGFLGAGSIMRNGSEVRGLTTAASVWAAASIGMAVAIGGKFLIVAVVATLLVLVTLAFVDDLARFFIKRKSNRDLIIVLDGREHLGEVLSMFAQADLEFRSVRIIGDGDGCEVALRFGSDRQRAMELALSNPKVRSARLGH